MTGRSGLLNSKQTFTVKPIAANHFQRKYFRKVKLSHILAGKRPNLYVIDRVKASCSSVILPDFAGLTFRGTTFLVEKLSLMKKFYILAAKTLILHQFNARTVGLVKF